MVYSVIRNSASRHYRGSVVPAPVASPIMIMPGPRPGVFFGQALSPAVDPVVSGHIWDEFLSGGAASDTIGSLGWRLLNATVPAWGSEVNHPGYVRVRSTGAANHGSLYLVAAHFPWPTIIPVALDQTWIFRILVDVTACVRRIGMFPVTPAAPAAGFYLEHLSGETTWYAVMKDTVAEARVNTGVPVDLSWIKLRLTVNAITGQIDFYIDDILRANMNYTVDAFSLAPALQIVPDGAFDRELRLDFFEMRFTLAR